MKPRLTLSVIAAVLSTGAQAQNLIVNGSFEVNGCPSNGATPLTIAGWVPSWAYSLTGTALRRNVGSQHLQCKVFLGRGEKFLSQTELPLPGVTRQLILADLGGVGNGTPRTASIPYNVAGSWGTFSFPAVTLSTQQAPATHTRAEFHAKPASSLVQFVSTDPAGVVLDNVYAIPVFPYPKEPTSNLAGISVWNECNRTTTYPTADTVVGSPDYHCVRSADAIRYLTVGSDPSHQGGLILIGNHAGASTLTTKLVVKTGSGFVYARVYYYDWVNKRWWLRDPTPILTLAQEMKFGLQPIPPAFGTLTWTATPGNMANFVKAFGVSSYVVAKVMFTRYNGTMNSPPPTPFTVDVDQARIN